MQDAKNDFNLSISMFAELLSQKLEDTDIEFDEGFEPQEFLNETVPAMVEAMEAEWRAELLRQFMQNDPNNASKMRATLEG